MKKTTLVVIAIFCAGLALGQSPDPFGDMLRRMDQQMQRGLPPSDSSRAGSLFFSFPADTSFFFRFDTTFSNGGGSFFFHFSPMPGQQGMQPMADPFGLDQMMQQFFNFGFDDPFFAPRSPFGPADDGDRQPDDGLLPEERLRQQPETPATPQPAPKAKPRAKSDEIKTIRI